jgi:hypothetical protein
MTTEDRGQGKKTEDGGPGDGRQEGIGGRQGDGRRETLRICFVVETLIW